MKTSKNMQPLLMATIIIQSVFIFMSFTSGKNEAKEEAIQSYSIDRRYYDGNYFYVLISGGEAKGFVVK